MQPTLRIGDLRSHALLQRPVLTPDGQGGESSTYQTVAAIWVSLRPLRGQELLANQRQQGTVLYAVTAHGVVSIDATMRLVVGGQVLQVISPSMDDGSHKFIIVNCEVVQ